MNDWVDIAYTAWVIIANAGHNRGGWDEQDPEWVAAATAWRDRFHAALKAHYALPDDTSFPAGELPSDG